MAGGRPPKYRKDFHPDDFLRLAKKGKTKIQIALEWDINPDTIQDWTKKHQEFSVAVKKGRALSQAYWQNLGFQAMFGQVEVGGVKRTVNLGFYVWLTKNMFGWSDKNTDNSGNEDNDLDLEFTKYEPK